MAEMMIGPDKLIRKAERGGEERGQLYLELKNLCARDETGVMALEDLNLEVHAGEIVGIAGVSGNGQSKLVEVLAGQRQIESGEIHVHGEFYKPVRSHINKHKMYCLPEEPLRNTCVGDMSVAHNMAFRTYDSKPFTRAGFFLNGGSIRKTAQELIGKYRVKTPSASTPIRNLSGGNVQRAVLARELSGGVEVLVAQNPCFGLDFEAAADIRAQMIEARNRGAAVLLISEDLDEVLEVSDRIVVMFDGKFVFETLAAYAEIGIIGRHMAGHAADITHAAVA